MDVTVAWRHDERARVTTVEEVDTLLDRLDADARRAGRPQDVQLAADGGVGTLGIVVGHGRSVLNHIPLSGEPPYLTSVGNEDVRSPFTFYVAEDHHSETPWRNTVPAKTAREAARAFLLGGELDARVRWEEV